MTNFFIFIPNLLSLIRIALVYPILKNIYEGNFELSILFFAIASITDGLDGFIARQMNWQTELGTLLDPVADKILLSGSIFIFWINQLIPFYIFIVFFSRDVLILIGASIKMTIIESETPKPNLLGKLTTTAQIIYIIVIFIKVIFELDFYMIFFDIFVLFITIISLIVYADQWVRDLIIYNSE